MNNYEKDDGAYPAIHNSQWGADIILQLYNARSSFYNAVPCSREVVADNEIALPYDDFEAIVDKFDKIAVSPCQCRLSHKALGIPDPGDHPLETCITLGEEAEYTSRTASAARSIRRRRWKSSMRQRRLRHGHSGGQLGDHGGYLQLPWRLLRYSGLLREDCPRRRRAVDA